MLMCICVYYCYNAQKIFAINNVTVLLEYILLGRVTVILEYIQYALQYL